MWQVALPVQIGQSLQKLILNLSLPCCGLIIARKLWWPLRVTSLRDMASSTLQPAILTSLVRKGTHGAVTAALRAALYFVGVLVRYLWRAVSKVETSPASTISAPEYAIKSRTAFWPPLLFRFRSQVTPKCGQVASLGRRMDETISGFRSKGVGRSGGTTAIRPELPKHPWTQQAPSYQAG